MPIDSLHPEYTQFLPQWRRCRDAMQGQDSIKRAAAMGALRGTAYLPQPSGMEGRDYQAYVIRASWYNASARVRQGLAGLVGRKVPVVVAPAQVLAHMEDLTGTGVSLEAFSHAFVTEHLTTGRVGILLDLPDEAQAANAVRPQWTLYQAEAIRNWWVRSQTTGEQIWERLVLEEVVDLPDPRDPYQHLLQPQWRELRMEDGAVVVRVWRRGAPGGTEFVQVEPERRPTRRGALLPAIPFVLLNGDASDTRLDAPPLLDVVDLNLAHYRTNADYKHSLHMSALITAWVTGHENTEDVFRIGAGTAWVLPEAEAQVGFLETAGHGFAAMLDDMKAAEAQMAVLGARLLEPQQRSVEAAETHQIRQAAELSIMQAYARGAGTILTRAVRWHAWWAGATERLDDPSITVTLNTDFLATTLDAPTLTALVAAWTAGALTQEDLYYNLTQGDMIEPGVTLAEWQQRLQAQVPPIDPRTLVPGAGEV